MEGQVGRLTGKRCWIVGGTSGIGLAMATLFAQHGARVRAAGLPDSLPPNAAHPGVTFQALDATQSDAVEQCAGELRGQWGEIDVLCHAAGISGRRFGDGPLHACTDEGWERTLANNLTSVFLTNRAVARRWVEAGASGVILNVASVLAFSPSPAYFDAAAYAASKGGIIALSRLLAASYASRGIRVNVLAPGLVDTPMASRAMNDPGIRAYLQGKQPLSNGPCTAEACAEAALYLCSDAARFVTGQVVSVDGGWSVCEGQGGR